MGQYKGIIFNSVTVGALKGELLEAVRRSHTRTAVVTNHAKTEVRTRLEEQGLEVDVIVGGFDLNRYGEVRKPMPDQMFVAVAMMELEASEVVVVADCERDVKAASGAGLDAIRLEDVDKLPQYLCQDVPVHEERDFSGFEVPVTGIMGAIVGDVIGSRYEHHRTTDFNFPLFPPRSHPTDDSIGTLFVARWLLGDRSHEGLVRSAVQLGNAYPKAGFSHHFKAWLRSVDHLPYGGVTNGSAMRVSACGWAAHSLEEALDLARRSAEISHNSVEGVRGAQAIAACIFLARNGRSKPDIKRYVEEAFGYSLDTSMAEYRALASHDYTCEFSVPQAICCWLQSESYEETVRNAVSLAGDADTAAAISGSIAAATPGMEIPEEWARKVWSMMDDRLKGILVDFQDSL